MASASISATATASNSPHINSKPVKAVGAPELPSTPAPKHATPARTSRREINEGNGAVSIYTTDGRVKNPVPSKLKGKADNKNGNFGVMHIDINSSQAALRNAAAKRTSEETEAAAKLANMRGYQSIKRSKLAWNPQQESDSHPLATAPTAPQNSHIKPSHNPAARHIALSPHQTKSEQARLLTLLRSLHPVVVVDQLCRALAYFGGIPGALPSNDGLFPESAKQNGQGSLFVGWVAEIFPPIEGNTTERAPPTSSSSQYLPLSPSQNTVAMATDPGPNPSLASASPSAPVPASGSAVATGTPNAPPKRPRGRPRGSKSSRAGKDKGTRKSDAAVSASNEVYSVDESTPTSPDAGNPSQSAPNQRLQSESPADAIELPQNVPANSSSNTKAVALPDIDSGVLSTPTMAKRRGRPKGSRNRPKSTSESVEGILATPRAVPPPSATSGQTYRSPLIQKSTPSQTIQAPSGKAIRGGAEQQQSSPTIQTDEPAQAKPTSESTHASTANKWAGSVKGNQQPIPAADQSLHRKRKVGELAQIGHLDPAIIITGNPQQIQHSSKASTQDTTSNQTTAVKRRRVSRETHQRPSFNRVESQSPQVGKAASPVVKNNVDGFAQTLLLGSFDAQLSSSTAKFPNQHFQHHGLQQQSQPEPRTHLPQSYQQPNQQFAPTRQAQQQASSTIRIKTSHQQGRNFSGALRPINQKTVYGALPNMSSQGYYAQQSQMQNQVGHVGNTSDSFGRGRGGQNPQFSADMMRQGSDDGKIPTMGQDAVASERSPQGQTAGQQSSNFSSQHVPSSSTPASSLGQFQAFGEQSYLDMDYGLNDRDVQDAAAAFGDCSQLEVVLVERNIGEGLYQAMNR